MKFILSNGYIEITPTNNIFVGSQAQEIMHIAEKITRKAQCNFYFALTSLLKEITLIDNNYKNERSEFLLGLHGNGLNKF